MRSNLILNSKNQPKFAPSPLKVNLTHASFSKRNDTSSRKNAITEEITNSKLTHQSNAVSLIPIKIKTPLLHKDDYFSQENILSILAQTSEDEVEIDLQNNTINSANSPRGKFESEESLKSGLNYSSGLFHQELLKYQEDNSSPKDTKREKIEKTKSPKSIKNSLKKSDKNVNSSQKDDFKNDFLQDEEFINIFQNHFKYKQFLHVFVSKSSEVVQSIEQNKMLFEEKSQKKLQLQEIKTQIEKNVIDSDYIRAKLDSINSIDREKINWQKTHDLVKNQNEKIKALNVKITDKKSLLQNEDQKRNTILKEIKKICNENHSILTQFVNFQDNLCQNLTFQQFRVSEEEFAKVWTIFSNNNFVKYSKEIKKPEIISSDTLESFTHDFLIKLQNSFEKLILENKYDKVQIDLINEVLEENMRAIEISFDLHQKNQNCFQKINTNASLIKNLKEDIDFMDVEKQTLERSLVQIKMPFRNEENEAECINLTSLTKDVMMFEISMQSLNNFDSVNSLTEFELKEREIFNKQKILSQILIKLENENKQLSVRQNRVEGLFEQMEEEFSTNSSVLHDIISDMREFIDPIVDAFEKEQMNLNGFIDRVVLEKRLKSDGSLVVKKLRIVVKNLIDSIYILKTGKKAQEIDFHGMYLCLIEILNRFDHMEEFCQKDGFVNER